jgi:hypothetical protein
MFVRVEFPGAQLFATSKLGFGFFEFAQALFPLGFDAAGDETAVGIDGAIAALGALRLVARALDRKAPLCQSSITIGFEALCGGDSGLDPKRRDRGKH